MAAATKVLFMGSFEVKLDKAKGRVRLPKRWRGAFRGGVAFVHCPGAGCLVVAPTRSSLEDSSSL